uniref:Peptidase S1 domain-containing protein n=1 Tax=Trichogramma kaykai TaxID=54128 RepID=A0ABD2WVM4_9HYME
MNNLARPRIINGAFAKLGQFPYVVSLQHPEPSGPDYGPEPFCGGAILDELHVITAAHCVTYNDTYRLAAQPILVAAGTTDLSNLAIGFYRFVRQVFVPESYTHRTPERIFDDLAILRLQFPLPLRDYVSIGAVELPAFNEYLWPNRLNGVVAGFGDQEESEDEANPAPWLPYLKYARGIINARDNYYSCSAREVCFKAHGYIQGSLEGVCVGDSGGPLVVDGSSILVGIISYSEEEHCATHQKFMRVSAYLEFIRKVLKNRIDYSIAHIDLIQGSPTVVQF